MLAIASSVAAVPLVLSAALASSTAGCETQAVGVETCRRIETARCENARRCGIDLSIPLHQGSSPSDDVGACKRYYDVACLHGLVAPTDPGPVAAQACVDALNAATNCDVIKHPETSPACAFLNPPDASPSSDAASADSGADAGVAVVDAAVPKTATLDL